jgi:hypothetical protein
MVGSMEVNFLALLASFFAFAKSAFSFSFAFLAKSFSSAFNAFFSSLVSLISFSAIAILRLVSSKSSCLLTFQEVV